MKTTKICSKCGKPFIHNSKKSAEHALAVHTNRMHNIKLKPSPILPTDESDIDLLLAETSDMIRYSDFSIRINVLKIHALSKMLQELKKK